MNRTMMVLDLVMGAACFTLVGYNLGTQGGLVWVVLALVGGVVILACAVSRAYEWGKGGK